MDVLALKAFPISSTKYKFTFCMLKTNNKDVKIGRRKERTTVLASRSKGNGLVVRRHYEGALLGLDYTNRGQSGDTL